VTRIMDAGIAELRRCWSLGKKKAMV